MVEKHDTTDTRVVYGFFCSWWGGIEEAGKHHSNTPHLPGCPHCRNGLLQVDTAKIWWDGVEAMNAKVPGYKDFISWLKGKCYREHEGPGGRRVTGFTVALAAYNENEAKRPGRVRVVFSIVKPED